jgi:hypothetical protein
MAQMGYHDRLHSWLHSTVTQRGPTSGHLEAHLLVARQANFLDVAKLLKVGLQLLLVEAVRDPTEIERARRLVLVRPDKQGQRRASGATPSCAQEHARTHLALLSLLELALNGGVVLGDRRQLGDLDAGIDRPRVTHAVVVVGRVLALGARRVVRRRVEAGQQRGRLLGRALARTGAVVLALLREERLGQRLRRLLNPLRPRLLGILLGRRRRGSRGRWLRVRRRGSSSRSGGGSLGLRGLGRTVGGHD